MEIISIHSFLYVAIAYLVTYFIGHIAISFIKIPDKYPFLKEFSKLVAASFIIITVYAVYKSNGITVNTGIIFCIAFFLIWIKNEKYIHSPEDITGKIFNKKFLGYLVVQLFFLFFIFLFLLFKIKNPVTNEIHEVYGDLYLYPKIIENLNKTGVEAVYIDWYSGIPSERTLYHFGELWQSAFYMLITGQSSFSAFYFQLFSVYLVIYIIGACSLIEIFIQPQHKMFYALSVLIILTCGVSFYFPSDSIFTKGDWWNISLTFQPKYFFPAVLVFYAILLIRFSKVVPLLLIAIASAFVCNVIVPAVFLFAAFLVFFLLISKKIDFSTAIRYTLIIVFAVAFIGIYSKGIYYLNNRDTLNAEVTNVSAYPFSLPAYLKIAFNCFTGQFIKSILCLFFFIVTFFVISKSSTEDKINLKNIFPIILFLHIASLLSYAIFHNMVDAVQLWTNIYLPLSAVVSFMAIAYLFNNTNLLFRFVAVILIVLCFFQSKIFQRFQRINQQYMAQVFQKYDGSTSVFYKSGKDFTSVFSKNINVYIPNAFLIMKYKEFNPVCLSVFDIPMSKEKLLHDTEETIIRNSVFNRFIQVQKKNHEFVSVEQSQLDFIKKNKVKYAFTYLNSRLPDTIQSLVVTSATDSTNGITFYQLK